MNVWAIVPVKPFNRAKSRLSESLGPEQRAQLAEDLLLRTLRLLREQPGIRGVLVISRDTKALSLVRDEGVHTVQESGSPELNSALQRATQVLLSWRADAALIVPADLPLLASGDIQSVLHLGRYHNSMVIAPDRHGVGTNLLLVRPPGLIDYTYGLGSFERHQQLGQQAGASVLIHRSDRAALDLDTPEDLAHCLDMIEGLAEPELERAAVHWRQLLEQVHLKGMEP